MTIALTPEQMIDGLRYGQISGVPKRDPVEESWRSFDRPASIRAFAKVADPVLDEAGNVRSATIHSLDVVAGETVWRPWKVGDVLCLADYRLRLDDTRRAGLHVVALYRRGASMEPRFVASFRPDAAGVFVLSPSNVVQLGEPLGHALSDPVERHVVRMSLHHVWRGPLVEPIFWLSGWPRVLPDAEGETSPSVA